MENVPNHYKDPGSLLNNQYNGKEQFFFLAHLRLDLAIIQHLSSGFNSWRSCQPWVEEQLDRMPCYFHLSFLVGSKSSFHDSL